MSLFRASDAILALDSVGGQSASTFHSLTDKVTFFGVGCATVEGGSKEAVELFAHQWPSFSLAQLILRETLSPPALDWLDVLV